MWLYNNSWHKNPSLTHKHDYELDADYKIVNVSGKTTEFRDYAETNYDDLIRDRHPAKHKIINAVPR